MVDIFAGRDTPFYAQTAGGKPLGMPKPLVSATVMIVIVVSSLIKPSSLSLSLSLFFS